MPIFISDFSPTLPFRNHHFNTMYRALLIKDTCQYFRKRITTWDNDFIDLDFSKKGSNTLALLIHGLEGSSQSNYMASFSNYFNANNIDTVCMNLRGCSGEDNLLLQTYHSGKTDDVAFIVQQLIENYTYENLLIIGFSLGGNLTLKYLGENAKKLPKQIKGAVAISVPIDIGSSERELAKLKNKPYRELFFKTMKNKVLEKSKKFPNFTVNKDKLFKAKKFSELEALYTVPAFGFKNPQDYWKKASSKPYLQHINVPTLLINAKDDMFLGQECFPRAIANNSKYFYLEVPNHGGHVGFINSFNREENKWLERRAIRFFKENRALEIL